VFVLLATDKNEKIFTVGYCMTRKLESHRWRECLMTESISFNWKSYHHRSCNTVNKINIDCASLENLADVTRRRNFKFVKGNICSSDLVNFVLEEEEIDTIVHLAAQTHVDNSFGNSFSFTQNNILGTHVLLESAKVHGIRRFVHVSTDEVYGEGAAGQEPMFEDNVLEVRLTLHKD